MELYKLIWLQIIEKIGKNCLKKMNYDVNYWVSKFLLEKASNDEDDKLSFVESLWCAGHYANHFVHIIFFLF